MATAHETTIASKTTDVDGLTMHYFTAGSGGETLVLIHGYAQSAHMWQAAMPDSKWYSLISPPAADCAR